MDHVATVRRFHGLVNAGDFDAAGEILADDLVEHEQTSGLEPTKDASSSYARDQRAPATLAEACQEGSP
jgi:hypothetical protein